MFVLIMCLHLMFLMLGLVVGVTSYLQGGVWCLLLRFVCGWFSLGVFAGCLYLC